MVAVLKTASKSYKAFRGLSLEVAQYHICCLLFVKASHMARLKGQGNSLHPLTGMARTTEIYHTRYKLFQVLSLVLSFIASVFVV